MEFVLGSVAAMGAGFFTNPIEVAKTRMQLQGERQLADKGAYPIQYRNVTQALYAVWRTEGWLALQRGLVPALWYQMSMNGVRLGAFQWMEEQGLLSEQENCSSSAAHRDVSGFRSVLGAAVSGCLGAAVGSPFFLVKTQMQARRGPVVAREDGGTFALLRHTYRYGGGVRGLWRGSFGAMPRLVVGSSAQLTAFTESHQMLEHHLPQHVRHWAPFGAALASGVAVTLFMTPFDLVSTRLYNQGVDTYGRGVLYSGWWDCVAKITRNEGIRTFYTGSSANLVRIGAHSVLIMFFWHQLRELYNHYSSGR